MTLKNKTTRSINVLAALPPHLLARVSALRGVSRLLGYGRLTWSEIVTAGVDAIEAQYRQDAIRRGMDWDRLAIDALGMERASRERRRTRRAASATASEPSAA